RWARAGRWARIDRGMLGRMAPDMKGHRVALGHHDALFIQDLRLHAVGASLEIAKGDHGFGGRRTLRCAIQEKLDLMSGVQTRLEFELYQDAELVRQDGGV